MVRITTLTVIMSLTVLSFIGNVCSAGMKSGNIAIEWLGCPYVRYWLSSNMALEAGLNLDFDTTSTSGVSLQNSMFISGRILSLYKEQKNFNVNIGAGIDLNTISNLGNVAGNGMTTFNIYGIFDIEFFIPGIQNLSLGSAIMLGINTTTTKIGTTSTTTTGIGFASNGFTTNTLNIKYYFK